MQAELSKADDPMTLSAVPFCQQLGAGTAPAGCFLGQDDRALLINSIERQAGQRAGDARDEPGCVISVAPGIEPGVSERRGAIASCVRGMVVREGQMLHEVRYASVRELLIGASDAKHQKQKVRRRSVNPEEGDAVN